LPGLALAACLALTACGLRVDHGDGLASGPAGSTGGGDAAAQGLTGGAGTTGSAAATKDLGGGTTGAGSTGGATGGGGALGTSGSYAGTVGSTTGSAGVRSGAAGSSEPLVIGFQVTANLDAAFKLTGAQADPPQEENMVLALTKWVNDTGGIHGRKVQLVLHRTDITSGTFASQAAEACADFTQDHHVLIAAISPVTASDDLLRCIAGKHVPVVEQSLWPYDDTYYRMFPGLLYEPGRASPDRWAPASVDVLNAAGYFGGGAKVGLVKFDAPVYERMANRIRTAMKRRGLSFTKEIAIATPASLSDFGAMSGALNNAIVQFRQAGVDHVMFAASGELPFFFMSQAESQSYRPRYGLTTNDVPDTQVGQGVPPAQFAGALAAGWQPSNDVGDSHDTDRRPGLTLCLAIMKKYGVPPNGYYSSSHCDSMFLIRRVLEAVPSFSVAAMQQAVNGFGTSFNSALTTSTAFGRGRYDGASRLRLAKYDPDVGSFVYVGPLQPM
jgi:ABC-type branched-subunit amino acid transport system substrate-binding protein